jgi:hypothetical protein
MRFLMIVLGLIGVLTFLVSLRKFQQLLSKTELIHHSQISAASVIEDMPYPVVESQWFGTHGGVEYQLNGTIQASLFPQPFVLGFEANFNRKSMINYSPFNEISPSHTTTRPQAHRWSPLLPPTSRVCTAVLSLVGT